MPDVTPPISPAVEDIGQVSNTRVERGDVDGYEFQSEGQLLLKGIKEEIELKQVTIASLGFAPDWLLTESIQAERESNWKDA